MKFLDILRMTILELFIGLLVYYLLTKYPELVNFVSSNIFVSEMTWIEYMKLFTLPIAILSTNYKFGDEILNPSDKENRRKLKEYPLYWMIKNRIWYSILVSLFVVIGTILCWYNAINTNNIYFYTIIILVLWSISLTTFMTMAKAKLDLKDILY